MNKQHFQTGADVDAFELLHSDPKYFLDDNNINKAVDELADILKSIGIEFSDEERESLIDVYKDAVKSELRHDNINNNDKRLEDLCRGNNIGTQKSTLNINNKAKMDVYDNSTPYFDVTNISGELQDPVGEFGHIAKESDIISALNAFGPRVDHPTYYNLEDGPYVLSTDGEKILIECIDVIRNMPAWKANVIKYLWRCGEKHEEGLSDLEKELEDMEKANWYLNDKIKEVKRKLGK